MLRINQLILVLEDVIILTIHSVQLIILPIGELFVPTIKYYTTFVLKMIKLSHITLKFILLEYATKPNCIIQYQGIRNYYIHRARNKLIYCIPLCNGPTVFGLMNTKCSVDELYGCLKYCLYYLADDS